MELLFTEEEIKIIEKILNNLDFYKKNKEKIPKTIIKLINKLEERDKFKKEIRELNKKLLLKKMEIDSIFDLTSASYWSFDKRSLINLSRNLIMGQLGINKLIIFTKNRNNIEIIEKKGIPQKEETIRKILSKKLKNNENTMLKCNSEELAEVKNLYYIVGKDKTKGIGILLGKKIGGIELNTEDIDFLQTIMMQLNIIIDNIDLYQSFVEKERIRKELAIAKTIQLRMLPENHPDWGNIRIESYTRTSYEVGGDLYDFLEDKKNYYVTIGDVSGKGLSASLIMASAQASVRALIKGENKDLKSIIKRLNSVLLSITKSEMYMTFIILKINKDKKRFEYFNAGHLPGLLFRKNGKTMELNEGSYFLGMFDKVEGKGGKIEIKRGDSILLFTDGLSEFEINSKEIGIEGVKKYFIKSNYNIKKLYELLSIKNKKKLKDDLTMISINFS